MGPCEAVQVLVMAAEGAQVSARRLKQAERCTGIKLTALESGRPGRGVNRKLNERPPYGINDEGECDADEPCEEGELLFFDGVPLHQGIHISSRP